MGPKHLQKTLARKVKLKGIGLHSGEMVHCTLHPAEENQGIVFLRSDLSKKPSIKADITKVHRTDMCTTLSKEGAVVATVEHLIAALVGMGVDNVVVELNGPEVPILDGSSQVFADAILDAGIQTQGATKKAMRLKKKIHVKAGDKLMIASPANEFELKASIAFKHEMIGDQEYVFNSSKDFYKEIASARTFGFLREVEYLHKKGLARGGSLENAIVLDEHRVLNPEGLRFKNEFVRHKILDAIGDLALLGMPLLASIELHKSGHELHAGFLKKVLEDTNNYEIIELSASGLTVVSSSSNPTTAESAEEEMPTALIAHAY